jgi:DNA-binding CsgD family transcriptional regulator
VQEHRSKWSEELVTALYAAVTEIKPASRPLEILAELTRSDKAFMARHDFDRRQGAIVASFNVEPNFIETYKDLYAGQNPWLARADYFQAEGLVWRGSDIADLARIRETEFYKLFMYGQAIENTAHIIVRVRGPELLHVMLTRRPLADDYDANALEVCRLFAFHARHALKIGKALTSCQFVNEGLNMALDEVAAGVAIVELPATVRHMNRTCIDLLQSCGGSTDPGHARAAVSANHPGRRTADIRLPRALLDALAAREPPRSFILRAEVNEGSRPIVVEIRPIQLRREPGGILRKGFALICRSSQTEIEVDQPALRAAFGLTASEARVCATLAEGENIQALSQTLGISTQTARTHLKRIFDKTETTRQPELMRLLMTFACGKAPKAPPGGERRGLPSFNVLASGALRRYALDE